MATVSHHPVDHPPQVQRVAWLSVIIAGLVVFIFAASLTYRQKKAGPNTAGKLGPVIVATPESFSDFVGPVSEVRPGSETLVIKLPIIKSDGASSTNVYSIIIDQATELKTITDSSSGAELQPLKFEEIHVGDYVHVFGQENLYAVTTITPTKVYKVISQPT